MDAAPEDTWWPSAVIYQIYPRSFADSNGDGIGDLNGIRSRLPYLVQLGIDAIWLSPFYRSPQADAGYDVSDYRDVDPIFGTLDDFRALVAEVHEAGLRIVIDIVPNHTSDQHEWFRKALANPDSDERSRYLFRPGRGAHGELPPNNWTSNFGGSAWTRVEDGSWYLHLFAPEQPDLDWTNPTVIAEFEDVLRFWLDLGTDGFRIDVAHGLAKDPDFPDSEEHALQPSNSGDHPHWDRDAVHDVYRGWRRVIEEYGHNRMFVGEVWVPNASRFAQYLRADELHTAFNFDYLQATWDADSLRTVIKDTLRELQAVGAPATWVLSNHDVQRHVTRYGGGALGTRRARAAAMLMFALPGGAYVYQGEELGLPEVLDIPDELRQDPVFKRTNGERAGRDGCRVPLPWFGDVPPYGFSPGAATWLPQPDDWAALTAEAEDAAPDSMLAFYRKVIAMRRATTELRNGALEWVATSKSVLAFRRGRDFACVVNFGPRAVPLPAELATGVPMLSSDGALSGPVPADVAVWLRV